MTPVELGIVFIAGLLLIVLGADWLVDGSSGIARKLKISEFIIGLTIVGFGTSCPELVVSVSGAIMGNSDVSVGNVLGSNIFNVFLILGLTALISPVAADSRTKKWDLPVLLVVSLLLLIGFACPLNRWIGIGFLLFFAAYLIFSFSSRTPETEEEIKPEKEKPLFVLIFLTVIGLAGLVVGGQLFVDSALGLAKHFGLSNKFIAVTLLAGGTSLPELAACVVAAIKKKEQLALGNIVGSCIFNILLILGTAAVINPISFNNITLVDMTFLILSAALPLIFMFTGKKNSIGRVEGLIMVVFFVVYYIHLLING